MSLSPEMKLQSALYFVTATASCELCDDVEVAFWCSDCQQWMCDDCQRRHVRAQGTTNHQLAHITSKIDEVKRDVVLKIRSARAQAEAMTSHVDQLDQSLEKLKVKKTAFLQQSNAMQERIMQHVTDHFEALNAGATEFIHKEATIVRTWKDEAVKSLGLLCSRLQKLEELLADESPRLAVQGKKILEELGMLQKHTSYTTFPTTEVELNLHERKRIDLGGKVTLRVKGLTGQSRLIPKLSPIQSLAELRLRRFTKRNSTKLKDKPNSVSMVNGEIWTCQDNGIIQVFDQRLKCLRKMADSSWKAVCDVTPISNTDVVLAGYGGLFHVTVAGVTKARIGPMKRCDSCAFAGDRLFAHYYDPPRIEAYTRRDDGWEPCVTIILVHGTTSDMYMTMAVANNKLYVCSAHDNEVYVVTPYGEVMATHGSSGSRLAGELDCPFLCAVDSDESMLVADCKNHRLQVCDRTGQWSVLDLQPPVSYPTRAAISGNKLYVSSWWGQKLTMYTIG